MAATRFMCLLWATSIFLFFFSINTTHAASATPNKLYSLFQGIDVMSPCYDVIPDVISLINCVTLCQRNAPRCQSGSYHVMRRTCCLCDVTAFYYNVSFKDDPDGVYFQDPSLSMDIVHNNWTMVFRATAGTNTSFWNVWNNTGLHDDRPIGNTDLQLGCMTLNGSLPCRGHFRSQYLSLWGTLNVKQVSLRLYDKGTEKLNLLFNGTGSNVSSWMTSTRLLSSPWSDASQNSSYYNIFSVLGFGPRHFHINKIYGTCEIDQGWLVARDRISEIWCPWDHFRTNPLFLYSASPNGSVVYNNFPNGGVAAADVLAVFIKY